MGTTSISSQASIRKSEPVPLIVAHRGGKKDAPENTIESFTIALANGAQMIELDVQVSADGFPVLYHARKLEDLTNGVGEVSQHTLTELRLLILKGKTPQDAGAHMATLGDALEMIPHGVPVIVDLKSLPAEPLIASLLLYIPEEEWNRLIFYSTNTEHTKLLREKKPDAVIFEDRDLTRERLFREALNEDCSLPSTASWIGFEMNREVSATESFSLGEGKTNLTFHAWTDETVSCTREQALDAKIVMFGINSAEDYCRAAALHADAIYTDQPSLFKERPNCLSRIIGNEKD
jgi:glycerophosphoryl diester phosphodiesterase